MKIILNVIDSILGKVYGNSLIGGHIILGGLLFAPSNVVALVLFTIFMALGTVDVWTGKFSHKKVVFDKWSFGMTSFFVFTLLFWFGYFSRGDHGGIGSADFPIPLICRFFCFISVICMWWVCLFICWLIKTIAKKLWAYLNRWQQ